MIITHSKLEFATSHFATQESRVQESLTFSNRNSNPGAANGLSPGRENTASPVQISDAGRQSLQAEG
ncbi:MAG: hypothetical protein LBV29_07850, partial [Azoarcus sp.]|nr:hypothetical protein [Azoarcus sp.]